MLNARSEMALALEQDLHQIDHLLIKNVKEIYTKYGLHLEELH